MEAKDTVMSDEEINFYKHLYTDQTHEHFIYDFKGVAKAQAEISFKAGIREVVEMVNSCEMTTDVHQEDGSLFVRKGDIVILDAYWQAKLKEWGIK